MKSKIEKIANFFNWLFQLDGPVTLTAEEVREAIHQDFLRAAWSGIITRID